MIKRLITAVLAGAALFGVVADATAETRSRWSSRLLEYYDSATPGTDLLRFTATGIVAEGTLAVTGAVTFSRCRQLHLRRRRWPRHAGGRHARPRRGDGHASRDR